MGIDPCSSGKQSINIFKDTILMARFRGFFSVFFLVGMVCICSVDILAAVAPGQNVQRVRVKRHEDGTRTIEDSENKYRLAIPAPYWEFKTARQLKAGSGVGCGMAARVPDSLLVVARNKDAPAGFSLELKPDRFLLRSEKNIETYVEQKGKMLVKRFRGSAELTETSLVTRGNAVVYRVQYHLSQGDSEQLYMVADFFIRPEGEDVRVYELACMIPPKWYSKLKDDYEMVVDSFEYTGTVEESFYVSDAPAEKLPEAQLTGEEDEKGGGWKSIVWMVVAVFGVTMIYLFMRRGRAQSL